MSSRKEYEMLFQLNAQLGSSYSSTFKNAQGAITSMQKEIAALSKTQSDISAYQKQQDAVENSRKKLETLQQQYDNIQKEMQETGTFSSALENRLLAKQQQIDKTTASLESQTGKLNHMGEALREAGVDTDNLTGETARLGNEIDDLKKKQEEAADKANSFGSTASSAFTAAGQALTAAGITVALKEINNYFDSFVEASKEFEDVTAAMRRTVGGTKEEMSALGTEFKGLSTDVPILLKELGKVAETAGQLGVAQESVYEFTQVMAMLDTTTDLTAETAATMLAQFANITGLTDYERLGATVADLGDATATTATKVVEMSQGMAAAASIAGFSETDILAVSAAVGSLGVESQAGATAMSTLISTLYKAVETGSDKLTSFADVAGMSAKEFSAAWREDAVSAMDLFIKGLTDTERNGKSAIVILDELGITNVRQTKAILGLASAGDLLTGTIAQANRAWAENTALQEKAGIMYDTTQSQLIMRENAYNNLKIAIGDNYTPTLKELYSIETEVLKNVTEFVEKHPELVKAVTAFVGVIGLAVGGIAAYVAITKIATIVSAAFTAAIPGLNIIMGVVAGVAALTAVVVGLTAASRKQTDESWELTAASREQYNRLRDLNDEYEQATKLYGETSYEAQSLRWKIEELTAEYESGKQKLSEYKEAHDSLIKNYGEMTASHAESTGEIEKEQRSTLALIAKLQELTETTDGATENQQAILSIIQALNEQVPELALNYDDVINSSGGFIDSIYAIAEAQAAQARLESQWNEYIDRVGQHESLKGAKEAAEYNAKIAQEEYDVAYKAWSDAVELYKYDTSGWGMWFGTREQGKALDAAREHLDTYNAALEETSIAFEENAAAVAELEGAFKEYQKAQEEAAVTGENLGEVVRSIKQEMDELSAAYEESYNAALDSISGQYNLWDEAARVVAVSAGSINHALETQTKYWSDYNANLEKLSERGADIEGLSDMIASFADGSEDSVNAVAGMAKATDKELKAMVDNWQNLQKEQETVADSLAKLETDFAASMDALQAELESTIEEMNLSNEAAQSGRSTVEGFIKGSEDMLPAVRTAYSKIAKAAIAAIDAQLKIQSPSKVFEDRGEYTMSGFVGGVEAMEPEITEAMQNAANIGAKIFSEEESKTASIIPQFMQYLKTLWGGTEAVSAQLGDKGSSNIILTVSPQYEITGATNQAELESVLDRNTSNIKDLVLEILEDAGIDKARRAYV